MAREIFVSYSNLDKEFTDQLCHSLEEQGYPCWMAPRDILPGAKYAEAIIDAINSSKVFLLVLSANSNSSSQVSKEIERAASKDIPIIPVRLDDVALSKSMEYYISNCQWIDVSKSFLGKEIPALIKALDVYVKPAKTYTADPAQEGQSNPFTFGNPISEPSRFVGRKGEIQQIINRLQSSAHESTSIVGERRIGKTSLLKHLSDPEVAEKLGLSKAKFCLVYIDLEGLTDITPLRFWQRVLTKVSRSICDDNLAQPINELIRQPTLDLFDLEDLFEKVTGRGMTIVLFLDEFEYVTQNPNFNTDFFGGLRSLAIHKGFALIPTTRRELVELCHSNELKGSPFFNIFSSVVLRPFSHEEVNDLLTVYLKENNIEFSPGDRDFVYGLSGGYPFFIQMASYFLYDGKSKNLKADALEKYVNDNFKAQANGHYIYLWGHRTESEKATLLLLLLLERRNQNKGSFPTLDEISNLRPRSALDISALRKHGVLTEIGTGISIFSSSFKDWISNEIFSSHGDEEARIAINGWMKSKGIKSGNESIKSYLPQFKKDYWDLLFEITDHFTKSTELVE
jgi:AAA+ ATPase superfamily predicted ATPase